ncbi:collagen alpha-1(I) chain-like [Phacochoerus africanus]|uniref:collagen alpha-1(I) chain-like n=1 Tax=Phacochoerus africanus TaxID=41426 RepID=UPI001FDA9975|nr:collagen alpha-1(I) chain-like [Phacochoerus africanus]
MHLSRRAGGSGGASWEGAAPRGQRPRPRPSAGRLRVPAGAPGPASRAGPDPPRLRSGRGGGGEPPGTERRPAGKPGCRLPWGSRGAGGGGVGTRVPAPRPPIPLGAPSGIRPPAKRGWCKAAAATSFPPRGPGSPTKRCPLWPIVAPARSRGYGLGPGPERARAAFPSSRGFRMQLIPFRGRAGVWVWAARVAALAALTPLPL